MGNVGIAIAMGGDLDWLPFKPPGRGSTQGAEIFYQAMLAAFYILAEFDRMLLSHGISYGFKDMLETSRGDVIFYRMDHITTSPQICPIILSVIHFPGEAVKTPENDSSLGSPLAEMLDHSVELVAFFGTCAGPNVLKYPGEDITMINAPLMILDCLGMNLIAS